MRAVGTLHLARVAALLALAGVAAGCGLNTDTSSGPSAVAGSQTATQAMAPPPATQTTPAEPPWHVAHGRLLIVASVHSGGAEGPYKSFAVTLEQVEVRQPEGWVSAASAEDLASLNARPVDLARAKEPLLLAVGSAPAETCEALRLRFQSGAEHCSWVAADAPKRRRALALPEDGCVEVTLDDVKIEPGRTTVAALNVDLTKAAADGDTRRIAPAMFAAGDASKVVGRITGAVSPAAALPRVWACRADTGTPITCADADPADGRFTINDVPAGRYFLRVTAGGYQPVEDREAVCEVKAGAATEVARVTLTRRAR